MTLKGLLFMWLPLWWHLRRWQSAQAAKAAPDERQQADEGEPGPEGGPAPETPDDANDAGGPHEHFVFKRVPRRVRDWTIFSHELGS